MARIRTIKPEFPQSESMGRVTREARLCFVLLWTLADDSGRLRGNSRMLASLLYPYDEDAGTAISDWLGELETEGCIARYEVDGNAYLQISNWLDHQKIDKPSKSKIPAFDEASRILSKPRESSLRTKDQGRDQGEDHSSCVQTDKKPSDTPQPQEPSVLTFPVDGQRKRWELSEGHVKRLTEFFPSLDILAECRTALSWIEANAGNRKTAAGMPRFLNGWLTKAQNQGRGRSPPQASQANGKRKLVEIGENF